MYGGASSLASFQLSTYHDVVANHRIVYSYVSRWLRRCRFSRTRHRNPRLSRARGSRDPQRLTPVASALSFNARFISCIAVTVSSITPRVNRPASTPENISL